MTMLLQRTSIIGVVLALAAVLVLLLIEQHYNNNHHHHDEVDVYDDYDRHPNLSSSLMKQNRNRHRDLLFFGRGTFCAKVGGELNLYETRSVFLIFQNFWIRRGALPGTCPTVCSKICNHQPCKNDFRTYNTTNECECIPNAPSRCGNKTQCVNDQCQCLPGYNGNPLISAGSCKDINECNATASVPLNNCGANSFCTNTDGSFFCTCQKGYTGDPVAGCTDIDECANDPTICGPFGTCSNRIGSYNCNCASGYQWPGINTTCTDINECPTTNCGTNAFCTNTPGSYQCSCVTGYSSTGTPPQNPCTDINECEIPGICGNNATCTNRIGNYTCRCNRGFIGTPPSCVPDACTIANNGTVCGINTFCKNATQVGQPPSCSCLDGYSGDPFTTCTDIDECTNPSICSAGTQCFNRPGTYECLIEKWKPCPTKRDSTCVIGLKCAQTSRSDSTYRCCESTGSCTGGVCCNGAYNANEVCPSRDDLDCASGLECGRDAVLSSRYICCSSTLPVVDVCV